MNHKARTAMMLALICVLAASTSIFAAEDGLGTNYVKNLKTTEDAIVGGGDLTIGEGNVAKPGSLILHDNETGSSNTVTIVANTNISSSFTLKLPPDAGTNTQLLASDGTGQLLWQDAAAAAASLALDNLSGVAINTSLLPGVDDSIDLGSGAFEWRNLFVDGTANIDALVADTADINGGTIDATVIGVTTPAAATTTVFTATGDVTLGDAATDTVTFTADVASNIIPDTDDSYDLGAVGDEWKDLFIDGTANIDSLVADTADINGGNIDGTAIGAVSRSSAQFTTLDADGNVVLGDAATDTVTVNADVASALIPSADDTHDLGAVGDEWKDLFIDGTANIDALVADTADINGGTIDATVIGVTTPAAATTTVFTATGLLSADGDVVLGDAATDTVTFTADVASDIIPDADDSRDLGAIGSEWKDLFIDGTANIDALVADTADIDAGTIDGTAIGGNSRSTAQFTTLDANGNVILGDDGAVDTVTINGAATFATNMAMGGHKITGLATPSADTDASTKGYVDNAINGLSWKQGVDVATTAAGTLASDYEDGDSVDGVALATGDRILIKNQADATENGIYVVQASGAPARAEDFDSDTDIEAAAVFVEQGTTNGDTGWVCTSEDTGVFGAYNLNFAQFSSAGGYTAGDGLDLTGVQFSVDTTVVRTSGDQTVNGIKTFGSFAVTPSSAPTTDYQVANKKYVDDEITGNAATRALDNLSSVAINTSLLPGGDDSIDLGSGAFEWKDLFVDGTANIDALVADTADINGGTIDAAVIGVTTPAAATTTVFTATGDVTLGDAATDTVTITADVASNIIPDTDDSYDIGAVGSEWKDLFIDGTANIDALVADTADIDAGTIDGTAIGGNARSSAQFTTLDADGNVVIGSDNADTVTINADLASDLIPDGDNTRDLGSAAASFADAFIDGTATIATADINGGNIDGTVIGETTPAAATTTVFSATGDVTLGDADTDTVTVNGAAQLEAELVYTPSSTYDVAAGTGIPAAQLVKTYVKIQGSGGNVDISTSPQIAAGTAGQILILQCVNGAQTVKLDDGNGLALAGQVSFTMDLGDLIQFIYDGTVWREMHRMDHIP